MASVAGLGSRHDCPDPAEEAGGVPHLLEAWLCCAEPPLYSADTITYASAAFTRSANRYPDSAAGLDKWNPCRLKRPWAGAAI
jgi:hypothetical protein